MEKKRKLFNVTEGKMAIKRTKKHMPNERITEIKVLLLIYDQLNAHHHFDKKLPLLLMGVTTIDSGKSW